MSTKLRKKRVNEHIFKNRFQKGSGVYVCEICGKRTRDTGIGEGQMGYCRSCFDEMEKENIETETVIDITPYGSIKIQERAERNYENNNHIQ